MASNKKRYNLTLDEDLVDSVDDRHDNRSAFVERAILHELKREKAEALEKKHIEGYKENPSHESEFSPLTSEQEWPN